MLTTDIVKCFCKVDIKIQFICTCTIASMVFKLWNPRFRAQQFSVFYDKFITVVKFSNLVRYFFVGAK